MLCVTVAVLIPLALRGGTADHRGHPDLAGAATTGHQAASHSAAVPASTPAPPRTTPPAATPLLDARPVATPAGEFVTWALLDVATSRIIESSPILGATNSTESMIKAWIAADYLARHPQLAPDRADEITRMITVSDNEAAQDLYEADGQDDIVARMITTCGLTGTLAHHAWWSLTQMTATDAARLGVCIATGRAAGARTGWLLDQMRAVHGVSRFGPVDVLPGSDVAMKNGYTVHDDDGQWHVNCLAIINMTWSLAVMTHYPAQLGIEHGADTCRSITRQLADAGVTPVGTAAAAAAR